MDINNSYDRHLDPPEDDIEQEDCEECYHPMEYHEDRLDKKTVDIWWKCTNPFCPSKFEKYKGGTIAVVLDMSNHLVEVEQKLKDTQDSLKYVRNSLAYLEGIRQEREQTIETLEKVIQKSYQSQSNVVVRDTEYAIKRLTEAFDYHEDDCDPYAMSVFRKEWAEVKKILESYG